jgi:hypothetical protein
MVPRCCASPSRFLGLALAALALAAGVRPVTAQAVEAGGSVSGTVRGTFQGTVTPLPHATVDVSGPGVRRSVVADSLGHYEIGRLPAGALRLRASHPGHAPVTVYVMVPAHAAVMVDLELAVRPLQLPPVNVTADAHAPDSATPGAEAAREGRVAAVALETGAGFADAGLAEAVQSLGGNDPSKPRDVLFMRGSTTDMKLVLLDGAPVYTPFHVAGLMRSFDPDALGRADLLVGGAPARYDGGLSYILDLQTRPPRRDRIHASGSLDLLSGRVETDGPLGDHAGFLLSGRTLYDLGRAALGASPYGYGDILLGLDADPAPSQHVRATGFWNRESVRLDLPGTLGLPSGDAPGEAWWSNRALSLDYRARIRGTVLDAMVAGAGYQATLPLQRTISGEGPTPAPLLASAHDDRVRGNVEVARPTAGGIARFGVSFEDLRASYDAVVLSPDSGGTAASSRAEARSAGVYVDVSRSLSESVMLRAGVRADAFQGAGAVRLAPRAALTWMVAPEAFVTVAAGRYHQNVWAGDATLEASLSTPSPTDPTLTSLLPVATADHVVVSLDQTLGQRVQLGLSGFWKAYDGLPASQGSRVLNSGVDLRVQRPGDRATVWLGYQLSWYWSGRDLAGSTSDFTGRQLLSAGVTGYITDLLGGDVRVAYGYGLPYTSVPINANSADAARASGSGAPVIGVPTLSNTDQPQASPLAGGPEENFLRIDVELRAALHPTFLGRRWTVHPYLRVLNALDRRDALFYAFQPWRSPGMTPLAQLPVVPVVGFDWRF